MAPRANRWVRRICWSRAPMLKLALQPHLTLLALRYPVDDFRIEAVTIPVRWPRSREQRGGTLQTATLARRFRRTKPEPVYLAVHRRQDSVYYRRLDRGEFVVLEGLRAGKSIVEALRERAFRCLQLPLRGRNWPRRSNSGLPAGRN